jgi:hypothetical protein
MSTVHRPGGTGIVIEDRSELAALRALVPDWEELAAEAAEPSPFYEHWMLLPALEAYGTAGFRCFAVWDSGTLIGLFPSRFGNRFHGLPVRTLNAWRHRNMMLCSAPLVREKSAAKCIAALLDSGLAPVIELDWISAGGVLYGALADAAAAADLPFLVTDAYTRAVLLRERDPRPRFNSNMKNNLRRWQSRLADFGRVTPVRLGLDDDLAAWIEQFYRLEASGWKGRQGSAVACRADDRRFVTEVFTEAFRRGRLHISGLDLDGRPLTRHCMLAAGEGAFTFKIAYDETYAKCSPGILGEVENVRQFMESPGPRWVDSNTARENTSYARAWKDRRTVQRVAVGTRGLGKLAVAALPLLRLAGHALRAVRARVGPKRRAAQGTAPSGARDAGFMVGRGAATLPGKSP